MTLMYFYLQFFGGGKNIRVIINNLSDTRTRKFYSLTPNSIIGYDHEADPFSSHALSSRNILMLSSHLLRVRSGSSLESFPNKGSGRKLLSVPPEVHVQLIRILTMQDDPRKHHKFPTASFLLRNISFAIVSNRPACKITLWQPPTLIQALANHNLGDILCSATNV
jgi:hypothetical protein